MTPAEKDTRKMVMEIPTAAPVLRQLTVVASPGSVEIGPVDIVNPQFLLEINYHAQYIMHIS